MNTDEPIYGDLQSPTADRIRTEIRGLQHDVPSREPQREVRLTPSSIVQDINATAKLIRSFATGATRSPNQHKFDFKGFLSPEVLEEFGRFMHEKRRQLDGSWRDSDNWKLGIDLESYAESLLRHVLDFERAHNGATVVDKDTGKVASKMELLMAILFNAQGYAFELLVREGKAQRPRMTAGKTYGLPEDEHAG